jgi:6-phosphogluconolactonase (cycloisomerase 2 family)
MSVLDSSGKASAGSTAAFSYNIGGLAVAANNLVYVSSDTPQAAGVVNGYTFDPSKGTLTQVSSTNLQDNMQLATDASGKFLYVTAFVYPVGRNNATVPAIYQFSVNADGSLTPLSTPEENVGTGELGNIAVSPDDAWVCADTLAGEATVDVTCFVRNSDGTINGNDTTTYTTPIQGMNGDGQIAFTPDGQWVFAAGNVNVTIEEGSMKNPTSPATATGSADSSGIAVDPSGKWVVVAELPDNGSPSILAAYSIGSNGQLTAGPTTTLSARPGQIAFSKSGDLFVTTDSGTAVYSFNSTSGTFTELGGSPVAGTTSETNNLATPIAAQ